MTKDQEENSEVTSIKKCVDTTLKYFPAVEKVIGLSEEETNSM